MRMPSETKRVVFHGLSPMAMHLGSIVGSMWNLTYQRSLVELAKIIPSWRMKNLLYKNLGINILDIEKTIVAPNVWMDYIYPAMIEIGSNTVIGENTMLLAHFLYPDRMEIGPICIGRNCLVGLCSVIAPGVTIGDEAVIGANAIVIDDVLPGATLIGPKSNLLLPD